MEALGSVDPTVLELGNTFTQWGADAWLWAGNFLALIILTVALFLFAMHQGASGLISINLSLYSGYALYSVFPYRDVIVGAGGTPMVQAALSIGLFIALTAIPFMLSMRLTSQSFGQLSIIQNLILSLGAAVFLMALGYHVFDISNIYTFSDPLNYLFEPEGYFFYWFIAPLITLWFLAR